jgi:hypothetical protein
MNLRRFHSWKCMRCPHEPSPQLGYPLYCNLSAVDERGQCPVRVLCHEHRPSKRRCATVREMKEGPSRSAIMGRSQAAASCCGQGERCSQTWTEGPGRQGRERRAQANRCSRGRVTDVGSEPTGNRRSSNSQRKAAAFVRWHEPDDARVSSPDL